MINQELINTKVGAACARLGFPIDNAYFWQDTGLSEQAILNEIAVMDSEIIQPDAFDELERFYAAHGWSAAKLTEALNTMLSYQLTGSQLPNNLQANLATHQANKLKAKSGQTNFDPLPYKPSEVL
jgi:hypothetical protein